MIEVKNLSKRYSATGTKVVVRGVSFKVQEGQFYSLLGPSGCGKTTTLRCVAGLELPDDGEITIGDRVVFRGQKVNVPAYSRGIGMVFQSYAIWPHLTVFENTAFPLTTGRRRYSQAEIRKRVLTTLEFVGLNGFEERSATLLSGGQQQRLALARAIIAEPRVLLLDEPLSNLDAKLREQMREELRKLQQRLGITTLYVTHDQVEALSMSDRIAVMNDGVIMQEGPPEEIYYQPGSEFVAGFLGNTNLIRGVWKEGPAPRLTFELGEIVCSQVGNMPHGEQGCISIRPENVQFVGETPGDLSNTFEGVVESAMFAGQHFDCHIKLGQGYRLRVYARPEQRLSVGQSVRLRIPPGECTVVQTESRSQ